MASDAAQRSGARTKVRKVRRVSDTRDTATTGRARAKAYKKTPGFKRAVKAAKDAPEVVRFADTPEEYARDVKAFRKARIKRNEAKAAATLAPALKVLEQTTRPVHAIAGITDAAITGKSTTKAGLRGLQNKDKTLFSDVLKHAGAPKSVQKIGGFALDVAADPTTYVTFGAGSIAKKAAIDAAEKASAKAARKGMSKAGQDTVAKVAAQRAVEKAPAGKGLTLKFAGHDIGAVQTGTAKAARAVRKVTKAPGARTVVTKTAPARAGAREVARDFRPMLKPADVPESQFVAVRQAGRRARASTTGDVARVAIRARTVAEKLDPSEHLQVIDAIERGKLGTLPDHLHEPARFLRDQFRHSARLKRQAGISEGSINAETKAARTDLQAAKGYFPHQRTEESLLADRQAARQGVGKRNPKPSSSKVRSDTRRLAVQESATPGRYNLNVPEVYAQHMADTAKAVHASKMNRAIVDAGRAVKKGDDPLAIHGPGDAIYQVRGGHIRELAGKEGKKELERVAAHGSKAGRYVVLNKRLVDEALAGVSPTADRTASGAVIDRATGAWKSLATFTPGFHARNLVGDTQMAYLGQPAYRLPVNIAKAGRVLRHRGRALKAEANLTGKAPVSTKTVKLAGKDVPVGQVAADLEREGTLQAGYIGGELKDLAAQNVAKRGVVRKALRKPAKVKAPGKVRRVMEARENLMRAATGLHALDKGATAAQAADRSAAFHIDYRDLSNVERKVMRRIAPFYTFTSRNIPIQAKALVKTPGKFANLQKIREEGAKATGVDYSELPEYQQRNLPVAVKIGGKKYALSNSLPATALNELPVSPARYPDELMKLSIALANPAIKTPAEIFANYNAFFRGPIQDPTHPLVAAPSYVGTLPASLKKKLGVVPDYVDKRSGKKGWGWPAKIDYIFKQPPGPANLAQQVATAGSNRRGQGLGAKLLSGLGGVKSDPIDKVSEATAQISMLKDASRALDERMAAMRQRGINADHPSRMYTVLGERKKKLDAKAIALSVARGDKIPLGGKVAKKKDPLKAKYGLGGASPTDSLKKKYGLGSGASTDSLKEKYGL